MWWRVLSPRVAQEMDRQIWILSAAVLLLLVYIHSTARLGLLDMDDAWKRHPGDRWLALPLEISCKIWKFSLCSSTSERPDLGERLCTSSCLKMPKD